MEINRTETLTPSTTYETPIEASSTSILPVKTQSIVIISDNTKQQVDKLVTASQSDEFRYFLTELVHKSTRYECFYQETYKAYQLNIKSKLKKSLNEIILTILSSSKDISYYEWKLYFFWVSLEIEDRKYDGTIVCKFSDETKYNENHYKEIKSMLQNHIFPQMQEVQETLTHDYLMEVLDIKEQEKMYYKEWGINLAIPTVEWFHFCFKGSIYTFIHEFSGIKNNDYNFWFDPLLQILNVYYHDTKIRIQFSQNNNYQLGIEISPWYNDLLHREFIQNFLLNLLKYLRIIVSGSKKDHIRTLQNLWVQVNLPQENTQETKKTIDDYYKKYWFIGYNDVKDEISTNIITPWEKKDEYISASKEHFSNIKDIIPNALLFEWTPWTWKTTYARIIWEYLWFPFVYIPIGSLMSKWYGESEQRLQYILETCWEIAKEAQWVVIMIDEIDEIGWDRNNSHEATGRITWVLLKKLDGLERIENTLLICSTNRKDAMDAALLSRFKLHQNFRNPSREEIPEILNYYIELNDFTNEQIHFLEWKSGREIKTFSENFVKYYLQRIISWEKDLSKSQAWNEYFKKLHS